MANYTQFQLVRIPYKFAKKAERKIVMKIDDWIKKLDAFLQFNDYGVLKNAGKVTREVAKALAENEFASFRTIQDKNYISDFDKKIKKLKRITK
jgi:hypothetical protein